MISRPALIKFPETSIGNRNVGYLSRGADEFELGGCCGEVVAADVECHIVCGADGGEVGA